MKKERRLRPGLFLLILALLITMLASGCGRRDAERSDMESIAEANTADTAVNSTDVIREKQAGENAKTVTILCYVNGSNLETQASEATLDIAEMVDSPYSENVNILIQTMGTKQWNRFFRIASDHTQRYLVKENGLLLVDDSLEQLDCTRSSTLSDFITWGAENYPADRYILLFWDHGGGPVYGFGYDEHQTANDAMTIDEIQLAVNTSGVYFDFIGMDCCIMSCMEVCCALYDACDYMILSEDFESGLGWSYTGWLTALAKDPSMDTVDLAKILIDDFVTANETSKYGDSAILSLIDQSMMKILYCAWTDFAYANEAALLESNYSQPVTRKSGGRYLERMRADDYSLSDYNITDIMAVAQNIESDEAAALSSAVGKAIVYSNSTEDEAALTGLSVTLPYGSELFYRTLRIIFLNCGFDEPYVDWLGRFVNAGGASRYFDYEEWDEEWSGWENWEDDYDWSWWTHWSDEAYWTEEDLWGWCDWNYEDYWDEEWWSYDEYDYMSGSYYDVEDYEIPDTWFEEMADPDTTQDVPPEADAEMAEEYFEAVPAPAGAPV